MQAMKKVLLILALTLPLFIMKIEPNASERVKTVYICTGPKAKVYHAIPKCKGLNRCSGEIKAVSLETAKKTRRACKICY